jgi:hypothetical protein
MAENIAWESKSGGFTTSELARALVDGWKKSPGHRKNMLDRDVEEIGVGVARSKKTGRYDAVQVFGRPLSKETTFKISNQTDNTIKYQVDGKDFTLRPGYTVTQRRARPPKLTFGKEKEKSSRERQVYRPGNNDHFTVRKDREGHVAIEED